MRSSKIVVLLVLITVLIQPVFGQDFNKNIIGYFTSWSVYVRDYHVPDIPADKINYINYAFANIDNVNGTIMLGDAYADIDKFYEGDSWEPGSLRGSFHRLQILKDENPHVKTLISVGGWTWSHYFSDIALTADSRATFAASCVDFIQQYEFDGVDLDWEYPVSGGLSSNIYRPEDKENFTLLLAELRSQLDQAGDYLLTIAAPSSSIIQENLEIDQIYQYLDWINVMTYDMHGPWGDPQADPVTHFNTPLYIASDDPLVEPYHSDFNLSAAIQGYLDEGVPSEKLNPGLAFYGRGYSGVPNVNNGLFQTYWGPANAGTWENGVFDYWDLEQNYINTNGYISYWHDEVKAPWMYNPNTQTMISYDNVESMEEKGDYIKSTNLGGAMFWEFSGDKYSVLLETVYDVLQDTTGTEANNDLIVNDFKLTNYPNPFNPTTTIEFSIQNDSEIELSIYNLKGQKIRGLLKNQITAGKHSIYWNGNDESGKLLSSGIYFYKLSVNDRSLEVKKCLMLK